MSLLCGRKDYRKEDGYEQSFIYHGYWDGYRKTYVTGLIVKSWQKRESQLPIIKLQ